MSMETLQMTFRQRLISPEPARDSPEAVLTRGKVLVPSATPEFRTISDPFYVIAKQAV